MVPTSGGSTSYVPPPFPRPKPNLTRSTNKHGTQRYRPDDYKGKGEPSFSHDQARRAKQPTTTTTATDSTGTATVSYEMQPTASSSSRDYDYGHDYDYSHGHGKSEEGVMYAVRRRSVGAGDQARPRDGLAERGGDGGGGGEGGSSGLERRNTGGKNLKQSLKRRLGSLRKKGGGEGVGS